MSTNNFNNYVPKSFFQFIIDKVYKEELDSRNYRFYDFINEKQIYFFDKERNKHANITFSIGGFEYTIDMWSFWLCEKIYVN